jgi:predicted RNase H-like HicB family nuclease
MNYSVLYEKINDPSFPENSFYAFIPTLDLVTHGIGIEGAKAAAIDLIELWIAEKVAHGEEVPIEHEVFSGQVTVSDALQIA